MKSDKKAVAEFVKRQIEFEERQMDEESLAAVDPVKDQKFLDWMIDHFPGIPFPSFQEQERRAIAAAKDGDFSPLAATLLNSSPPLLGYRRLSAEARRMIAYQLVEPRKPRRGRPKKLLPDKRDHDLACADEYLPDVKRILEESDLPNSALEIAAEIWRLTEDALRNYRKISKSRRREIADKFPDLMR